LGRAQPGIAGRDDASRGTPVQGDGLTRALVVAAFLALALALAAPALAQVAPSPLGTGSALAVPVQVRIVGSERASGLDLAIRRFDADVDGANGRLPRGGRTAAPGTPAHRAEGRAGE
jgi:hypothetical protein